MWATGKISGRVKGEEVDHVTRASAAVVLGYESAGGSWLSALRSPQPELLQVLQWGEAHVAVEVVGERALVAEAEITGHFGDLCAFFLQRLAGGLDAQFHDEGLRAGSKGLDELAVQLPWREMHDLREFGDGDASAEVLADVGKGAVDLQVGLEHLFLALKTLHRSHDADDAALIIDERQLVRDEPVRYALVGKEQFDDVELRSAIAEHFLVIATKILGETGGEQIKIVFADDAGLVRDAKAVHETLAGAHEAELRVLGEKSKVRQVIEQPVERTVRTDTANETLAQCGWVLRA